jgi:hypothetical protein
MLDTFATPHLTVFSAIAFQGITRMKSATTRLAIQPFIRFIYRFLLSSLDERPAFAV